MKRSRLFPVLALFLLAGFLAEAQNTLTLSLTTTKPKVDGLISAKEYSLTADAPDMELNLSWTTDTLFAAVTGQTTGWVGIGFGTGQMDGSIIYMGYVSGGKTLVKVQEGSGHTHSDLSSNAPVSYAMKEANGKTTLEVALKASQFIAAGQTELDLVLAMGSSDSFAELHMSRYGAAVALTR